MKKEFKVGDRVRVYTHLGEYIGTVTETNHGVLSRYGDASGMLLVKNEIGEVWAQHPRQCRRLVKKPAREWWMVFQYPTDTQPGAFGNEWRALECVQKVKEFHPNAFVVKVREVLGRGK